MISSQTTEVSGRNSPRSSVAAGDSSPELSSSDSGKPHHLAEENRHCCRIHVCRKPPANDPPPAVGPGLGPARAEDRGSHFRLLRPSSTSASWPRADTSGDADSGASHACDPPSVVRRTASRPTSLSSTTGGEIGLPSSPRPTASSPAWLRRTMAAADPTVPAQPYSPEGQSLAP